MVQKQSWYRVWNHLWNHDPGDRNISDEIPLIMGNIPKWIEVGGCAYLASACWGVRWWPSLAYLQSDFIDQFINQYHYLLLEYEVVDLFFIKVFENKLIIKYMYHEQLWMAAFMKRGINLKVAKLMKKRLSKLKMNLK